MKLKIAIISLLNAFIFTATFASVDPNMRTNGDQSLTNPNELELVQMENDSINDTPVKENAQPKKKEETEEDEESVSILSVNIILEIISQFNLRDLLNFPSK